MLVTPHSDDWEQLTAAISSVPGPVNVYQGAGPRLALAGKRSALLCFSRGDTATESELS